LLLPRDVCVVDAIETVARWCLDHADANVPYVDVHGDPEGLHQLRVAYRKLRSLLSLSTRAFRGDPAARDLRRRLATATAVLGPARDLDVYVQAHPEVTAAEAQRLDRFRVQAYAAVHDWLADPDWAGLREELDDWLAHGTWRNRASKRPGSARPFAARALTSRRDRILRAGANLARLSPRKRHRVRIEAKKLRYGASFFGSLWPRKRERFDALEEHLKGLQDHLGLLNDVITWERIRVEASLTSVPPAHVVVADEVAAAQECIRAISRLQPGWVH
jgi:CHAD domain-containing protein